MSNRYKGGIISATPPTTTGGESGVASGAWTLEQQMQAQAAGLWPIQPPPPYIEDVFSTYLYTGTSPSSQSINNGIDLSTKGGLVWLKDRAVANFHSLFDTNRGAGYYLSSSQTSAQALGATTLTSFNTNGFSLGGNTLTNDANPFASWTFRKQPKFFDVVTYTGDGTNGRVISHSINGTVGMAIVKSLNNSGIGYNGWYVRHRSATGLLYLNLTNAQESGFGQNITALSDTSVTVGGDCNESGETYVMYVFAHNAGGFGLTGTDNVISCGSYTTSSVGKATVDLGYEPQWVLVKRSSGTGSWYLADNMRGWSLTQGNVLSPNTSAVEADAWGGSLFPTATGFQDNGVIANSSTVIYIAIRRGPMKVPTSGTEVYGQQLNVALPTFSFPPDMVLELSRASDPTYGQWVSDRLRGSNQILQTFSTNAESSGSPFAAFNQGGKQTTWGDGWSSGYIVNGFRRAPSFFDEVCYTGNATAARNITHNLTVAPEMIIVKARSSANNWPVWATSIDYGSNVYLDLTNSIASGNTDVLNYNEITNTPVPPTSTTFTVGTQARVNGSGITYVAYLFGSVSGVSKVGTYTGTGATLTVNCGFTGGARFVMLKRTDAAGNWFIWDTARGMVSGTDPSLSPNSTSAENNANAVFTTTGGFEIVTTATSVNAVDGTYIFLAIA